MYSKTVASLALFLLSSATAQRPFLRRFRVVSQEAELYFIPALALDLSVNDPAGQLVSSLPGSKFIQNGKTYRSQDVIVEDDELISADGGLALDRYTSECTCIEGSGFVVERNICDYNLCVNGRNGEDSCIFLRSGGNFNLNAENQGPGSVPSIEATIVGGSGKLLRLIGKASIETVSSPINNGEFSFKPGATVLEIKILGSFGKGK